MNMVLPTTNQRPKLMHLLLAEAASSAIRHLTMSLRQHYNLSTALKCCGEPVLIFILTHLVFQEILMASVG